MSNLLQIVYIGFVSVAWSRIGVGTKTQVPRITRAIYF